MQPQQNTNHMSLFERLRVPYLVQHYPPRLVQSAFMLINGFIAIGILAFIAKIFGVPLVFPSLGPTAILLFLSPQQKASHPRNVLIGHAIAILCGLAVLILFGLIGHSSVLAEGISMQRIFAAALSLSLTGALMALLDTPHPPAGATTLIISLGFITQPYYLLIIEVAVAMLILQAVIINKLAGVEYPYAHSPRQ